MKYAFTFSMILFALSISWTQPAASNCSVNKEELLEQLELQQYDRARSGLASALDRYQDDVGSPFVSRTWSEGTIITKDNVCISNVLLAYDLYTHDLYCKYNDIESILNKRKISQFTLKLGAREKRFLKLDPIRTHGFAEVLFEDAEIIMFKRQNISRKVKGVSQGDKDRYHFSSMPEYFVIQKRSNEDSQRIYLKKKSILSQLSKARTGKARVYLKETGNKLYSIDQYVQMLEATRVEVPKETRNIIRI